MASFFETTRLQVRRLKLDDFEAFHEMQSSLDVMQYVRGRPMTFIENKQELPSLIKKYDTIDNDFWIYAIERKDDLAFIGTVALVKDENGDDEIGYRLCKKFWNMGYGFEVAVGLIDYCRKLKMKKIVAFVAVKNLASIRIIEKLGFTFVCNFMSNDLKIPERKYELIL